jgi:hypothetical protein
VYIPVGVKRKKKKVDENENRRKKKGREFKRSMLLHWAG